MMPLLIPYKVIKDTSSIIGSTSKQAVMWHIQREGWSDPSGSHRWSNFLQVWAN